MPSTLWDEYKDHEQIRAFKECHANNEVWSAQLYDKKLKYLLYFIARAISCASMSYIDKRRPSNYVCGYKDLGCSKFGYMDRYCPRMLGTDNQDNWCHLCRKAKQYVGKQYTENNSIVIAPTAAQLSVWIASREPGVLNKGCCPIHVKASARTKFPVEHFPILVGHFRSMFQLSFPILTNLFLLKTAMPADIVTIVISYYR